MDQTILLFMTFLLYPGFRKPGKQRELRDVMIQAWTIQFSVFKWTIQFTRTIRVETPTRACDFDQKLTPKVAQIILYYHVTQQYVLEKHQLLKILMKNLNKTSSTFDDDSLVYREMCRRSIAIQRHMASANSFVLLTCSIVLSKSRG